MPLDVIGAGFPRTGTLSLKTALETLGFAPCHHMSEVFAHPHLAPLWERAFDGTLADFEEIFHGYRATTDAPAAFLYDRIAARYPDAKVVLTVRDPEKWYASFVATIATPQHGEMVMKSPLLAMMTKMLAYNARRGGRPPPNPEAPFPPKEAMIASYLAHNDEVRRTIAPGRLLEFRVADGWEPLCRFLDRPVPAVPFPRVNDAEAFQAFNTERLQGDR